MKVCPFCAESIQDGAVVCRYCDRQLADQSAPPGVASSVEEKVGTGMEAGNALLGLIALVLIGGGAYYYSLQPPKCSSDESIATLTSLVERVLFKGLSLQEADLARGFSKISFDLISQSASEGSARSCSAQLNITLSPEVAQLADRYANFGLPAFRDAWESSDKRLRSPLLDYRLAKLDGDSSRFSVELQNGDLSQVQRAVNVLAVRYVPKTSRPKATSETPVPTPRQDASESSDESPTFPLSDSMKAALEKLDIDSSRKALVEPPQDSASESSVPEPPPTATPLPQPTPSAAPAATPAPLASPVPVRIGAQIKEPTKTKNVAPVYPDIAKQARVQGIVILECTISPQGRVTDVKVLRGIPLLDQAAIDAVKQWEYTPTLLDGVAVPVVMTVTTNFRLN